MEDPNKEAIPHNAVNFTFEDHSAPCGLYAIMAVDYGDPRTGLAFNNTCIGDGILRAVFDNGVVSGEGWKVLTVSRGPLDWEHCLPGAGVTDDHHCAPEGVCGDTCESSTLLYEEEWLHTYYDDTHWEEARLYSDQEVGPNTRPPQPGDGFLDPDLVDWGQSSFIWGQDRFLDNVLLFRYDNCV